MLDDDTLEIMLGPGTMPGTEITQELPVLSVPEFRGLPPHLAGDPILTMDVPHATHPSLFDHAFGPDAPRMLPGRPMRSPRVPIRARDHVLAAMAASVILLGVASYVMVRSGWRADMPQGEQDPVTAERAVSASPGPGTRGIPALPVRSPSVAPSAPGPSRSPQAPSASLAASPSAPGPMAVPRHSWTLPAVRVSVSPQGLPPDIPSPSASPSSLPPTASPTASPSSPSSSPLPSPSSSAPVPPSPSIPSPSVTIIP